MSQFSPRSSFARILNPVDCQSFERGYQDSAILEKHLKRNAMNKKEPHFLPLQNELANKVHNENVCGKIDNINHQPSQFVRRNILQTHHNEFSQREYLYHGESRQFRPDNFSDHSHYHHQHYPRLQSPLIANINRNFKEGSRVLPSFEELIKSLEQDSVLVDISASPDMPYFPIGRSFSDGVLVEQQRGAARFSRTFSMESEPPASPARIVTSDRSTKQKQKSKLKQKGKHGPKKKIEYKRTGRFGACAHCSAIFAPAQWRNVIVEDVGFQETVCNACGLHFDNLKRHYKSKTKALEVFLDQKRRGAATDRGKKFLT